VNSHQQRSWPCHCRPLLAVGRFAHGRLVFALHGPGCDRPVERRQTLTYRLAERTAK